MTSQSDETSLAKPQLTRLGIRVVRGTALAPVSMAILLFVGAGRLDLPRAWLFLGLCLVGFVGHVAIVAIANPDLINRRALWKSRKDTNRWDRRLIVAYGMLAFTLAPLVTGINVGRFPAWTLGTGSMIAGTLMFAIGTVIITWAMLVNTHFETTVRIQHDRNHQVVSTGPYAYVRHPGYVGASLWALAGPLIVGSPLGLIPAILAVAAVVARSRREETLLRSELPGYADYAARVRYRFIPGLW